MKWLIKAAILLVPFVAPACVHDTPRDAMVMETYLAETFGTTGPGVSALVVKDGETLYRGAVGFDVVAEQKPLLPDQPFQIGSVSKTFTAATVLKLAEEGRIDIDAPAAEYFPQIGDDRITTRQLLLHTSGMPRGFGFDPLEVAAEDRLWPLADYTSRALAQDRLFEPGAGQAYSGPGYALLGAIIESVTGRPWYDAVTDKVIAPTGVSSIRFEPDRRKIPGLVTGYLSDGEPFFPDARYYVYQDPAAGLVGDLDGLAEWFEALFAGEVVSAASLEVMTDFVRTEDGGSGILGAGLMKVQLRTEVGFMHTGRVPGYGTVAMYFPDEKLFVGLFSNNDLTSTPLQNAAIMMASIALEDPLGADRSEAARALPEARWFGEYRSGEDTMRFEEKGMTGQLIEFGSGETAPLAPAGNGVLIGPDAGARWAVLDVDDENTPVIRWTVAGEPSQLWTRTGDIPEAEAVTLAPDAAAALAGTYQLPIGPFLVEAGEDGSILVTAPGAPPSDAQAVSATRLSVPDLGIAVDFELGPDGKARAISIAMGGQTLTGERID